MFRAFQLTQVAELRSLVISHRERGLKVIYGTAQKLRNKSGTRHEGAILHEEKNIEIRQIKKVSRRCCR